MKTITIVYWVTTSIVGMMMVFSTYTYFTAPVMAEAFHHLGYPDHFRIELAVAKFIGAILLVTPVRGRIKEWTYAGFTFAFISAFIAHTAAGDPITSRVAPVVFLLLLVASYITFHKRQSGQHTASV